MPRPSPYVRPLSMTVRTKAGQSIAVAATFPDGAQAPPVLMVQGGLWRIEIPEEEAQRLVAFVAQWWAP